MGESIKSCGHYGNVDSFPQEEINLAFTIIDILNNKKLLSQYCASGLSVSNNYSVNSYVNSLIDLLR